ncbi:N-acetyltransferase family protein [Rhizobium sp. No.120]
MAEEKWNITTREGLQVTVRPAGFEDEHLMIDLFDHVSPQDLRFRFLSAVKHVSRKQIADLIGADHNAIESYLAFVKGGNMPVATAVLACDHKRKRGEVAIAVRSDFKGHGLGWEFLGLMVSEARKRGLEKIESMEDRSNYDAIELEENMGFSAEPCPDDPTHLLLSKSLTV